MRNLASLIFILTDGVFCTYPSGADWADKGQWALDKDTDACLKKNDSTGGTSACWEEASKKWDLEMSSQLNKLMAVLTPAEQKHLQASQLEWVKYRKAELQLIDDVYTHTSGSMFAPMQAASRVRIVRDRVLYLKHYRDLVQGL